MDLRAGSSTAEGGTRSRSLRGKILARPSSSCADDDDCLRIPPTSPPHKMRKSELHPSDIVRNRVHLGRASNLLNRAERSSPEAAWRRAEGAGLDGESADRAIMDV